MFWSIYPRLKFSTQIPVSVVQVEIPGTCATSSILRVLLSGFWVSGLQIPSPRDSVPGSCMSKSQFQGPGCQGLVSQGPIVPSPGSHSPGSRGPRVSRLRFSEFQVSGSQGSRSQVSGPDFRLCPVYLLKV